MISFVFIVLNYNEINGGYEDTLFMPLLYCVATLLLYNLLNIKRYSFTFYGVIIMEWLRFVAIPFLYSISHNMGHFDYLNPPSDKIKFSIYLMAYELIITYAFTYILISYFNKKVKYKSNSNYTLLGSLKIYIIFVVFSFIVLILIGIPRNIVRFIYISLENSSERIGDNTSTAEVLYQYIITSGAFIFFIIISWLMYKLYRKNDKIIYYYISLIAALFNVSLIIGERRTAQIYIAITCVYLMIKLFPKYKNRTIIYIFGLAIFILTLMSIYKFFGAFTTGSYIEAINNSNKDISFWSKTFQSYFFGPENVAMSIEFGENILLTYKQFIFDSVRSIFGINMLTDHNKLITSQIYNLQIYNGQQLTGHVLSSGGYGYIYFGLFFSPILSCVNILISVVIETFAFLTKSIELKFLFVYLLLRFCTNLYVNTPALMSFSTTFLGTTGLIMFSAILIKSIRSNLNA